MRRLAPQLQFSTSHSVVIKPRSLLFIPAPSSLDVNLSLHRTQAGTDKQRV